MYNKLFTKILDSSIWMESSDTRVVWLTLIAAMDEDGFAQFAGLANLAHRAIVSVEAATEAVKSLESPDPDSSDPENDGRRIERVPGGWMVLNAIKYREMVTRIASREMTRVRVARHRAKRNGDVTVGNDDVTVGQKCNDRVMQSEAYTEADSEAKKNTLGNAAPRKRAARRPDVKPESLDEMIQRLSQNPAYEGIDIRRSWNRMAAWCEVNRKEPTAKRFVNWLNREDRPITTNGNGAGAPKSKIKTDTVGAPSPEPPSCGKPAIYRFVWPECEPAVCCEECLQNVKLSAEALNLRVAITAVQGEPSLCP